MPSTTSSVRRWDRRVDVTAHARSMSVETIHRLYGEDFLVDESLWRGRAPGTPFGLQGKNRPLKFRLLHVVQFSETGDITRENVWIDLAAIINQLPQD
jgi:hypothetical protein